MRVVDVVLGLLSTQISNINMQDQLSAERDLAAKQTRDSILITRKGTPKKRFTTDEKLQLLDPLASIEATGKRFKVFADVFAFNRWKAIMTRAGGGPSDWRAIKGKLGDNCIIRHLLADQIPSYSPQWVGTRSTSDTKFFCIDVDSDGHGRADAPAESHSTVPSFAERCYEVEWRLACLGIHVDDPTHTLVTQTPSGGRHYYAFLDEPRLLNQVKYLLQAAGFRHHPGQIELFPSRSHGLRLPFGHTPGRKTNPNAWIRFVDRYRGGKVHCFSLEELYENLETPQRLPPPRVAGITGAGRYRPEPGHMPQPQHGTGGDDPTGRAISRPGPAPAPRRAATPRRFQKQRKAAEDTATTEKYWTILENGITCKEDAQIILSKGVLKYGTRTKLLEMLVRHMVWFEGKSEAATRKALTDWIYDSRNRSHDLEKDRENNTQTVETHIANLCRWYAEKRANDRPTADDACKMMYFDRELEALRSAIESLPRRAKRTVVPFLLHLVHFSQRFGTRSEDGSSWEVFLAINSVVRKLPGCSGMRYKQRFGDAERIGILKLIREKWQNPRGTGRPRTYRARIPESHSSDRCIGYDEMLRRLTGDATSAASGICMNRNVTMETENAELDTEHPSANRHEREDASDVPAQDPGVGLEAGAH